MKKGTSKLEFYNSKEWLEYTHKRYLTLEEIRHRIGEPTADKHWRELKEEIQESRKLQAIPLNLKSINKLFWFFPADCINEKIKKIETRGMEIFDPIVKYFKFGEAFIQDSLDEEAITSAIYEGANSTRAQAKQFIAENRKPKTRDEWMLINTHNAMNWIKENTTREIDISLILKIHSIITQNTMKGDDVNYIGKFRDDAVYIGPHEGIPFRLIEVLKLFVEHPRYIHPLIKGILLHYFIGYIHPFFDGNGRTARTLFYFKLIKNGLNFVELLSISAQLKEHGRRYERTFENAVIHDGDLTYFVDFCLDSMLEAISRVETKINYLIKIDILRDKLNLTETQIMLLQRMALNKFRGISIEEYAADIDRSREIARQELKKLT